MTIVDILGIVHFWDININSVSVINLSVAVGLSIDFSAHIGLAFMEAVGTRHERVIEALHNLGPSLVHGGISKEFLANNDFDISQINIIMRQSLERKTQ